MQLLKGIVHYLTMSILKEQAVHGHPSCVIQPFWHEKTRIFFLKGCNFVEIYGSNGLASFSGKLASSAGGLALFAGGLASSAGGLASSAGGMKPVRPRMKSVPQRMKPVLLVPIFFSYFSLFANVFFCLQRSFTIRISIKNRLF